MYEGPAFNRNPKIVFKNIVEKAHTKNPLLLGL